MSDNPPVVTRYANGEVTIPLEVYNKMMIKIQIFERSLLVKPGWDKTSLTVEFDPRLVEETVEELFEKSNLTEHYKINDPNTWFTGSSHIGDLKPEYEIVEGKIVLRDQDET